MNNAKIRQTIAAIRRVQATDKGRQWRRLGLTVLIFPIVVMGIAFWLPPVWQTTFVALQFKVFLALAACHAACLAFPRVRNILQSWKVRLQAVDHALNQAQQLYRSVVVLGICMLLLSWLGGAAVLSILVWPFIAFCLFVAFFDAFRWYRGMSEHALGKAILGLGFAVSSTVAYAIARQEIADIAQVTPTNLTHTTLLMAIMTIPVLLAFAGGAVYIACMLTSIIVLPVLVLARDTPAGLKEWLFAGTIRGTPVPHPLITKCFQFFFYGTLGLLVMQIGRGALPRYESQLQKLLPAAIYHLDMYHGLECKLAADEKLAPLGDAKFLIGKMHADGHAEILPPIKCDELPMR